MKTQAPQQQTEHPYILQPNGRWTHKDTGEECPRCIENRNNGGWGPPHKGSTLCKSKGLGAKDGFRSHCGCSMCF